MGFRLVRGNIFESGASALVDPVNCVGVSGAGLAKEFARRFPREQLEYEAVARARRLLPGTVVVVPGSRGADYIVYLPTKRDWRDRVSNLLDIEEALVCLRGWALSTFGVRSVALPALGCGLGHIDFNVMRGLIERVLGSVESIDVMLYEPISATKVA